MRLLQSNEDGTFSLPTSFIGQGPIPPYAILSHTWGPDTEEVTFEDLAIGAGSAKPGYEKILFCAEQARRDGLQYFWIDTCCIDKSNKAELALAIRSMYRWYRNAARCYVYLPDVSSSPAQTSEVKLSPWELDFRKSRWFTRGWTLQELVAPSSVEFFSKEQMKLGDKVSLAQELHEITGIPLSALQGSLLSQFSVEERLSWIEHRETKLAVDRAYALMGILGVSISPFDGEGAAEALRRLMDEVDKQRKCTQDLRLTDPCDDKQRIEATKGGLLVDSYSWILNNDSFQQWQVDPQSRLLWIKGDPGKGKTMLLCGIINELQKSITKTDNISYFFCQATDSRINSAAAVLRGLLFMLVNQKPSLISHVRKKYDSGGRTVFEDTNAWVVLTEIFSDVLRDPSLNITYLIIDALDECVTDLQKLLHFITEQSLNISHVKWIVSSRNWPEIEERLELASHKVRLSLELNAESVSKAVSIFIEQKVSWLAQQKKYDNRTRTAVIEHLTSNANDTFLWVALVCQNLEAMSKWNVLKKLNLFPPGLDSLYERMMQQIRDSDDFELCKQILASITLVYQPITLEELVTLVVELEDTTHDPESVQEIISLCGSFLTLRANTIYFVHQSAKDFLLTKVVREVFPSGKEDVHSALCTGSLRNLSKTLRRDIYGLKALGYSITEVKQPDPDPLAESRYSCVYWVDHLCASILQSSVICTEDLQDRGSINTFLQEKYLYWLEALSLCKSIPKGVVSMAKLSSLVQERGEAQLSRLVYDAHRFIMYFKGAIEGNPLQVYASALLFSPIQSLVRTNFCHEVPKWITIKPDMNKSWSACLQTLEGHSSPVAAVVFSPDGKLLASGSWDTTVKLWEASSGVCLLTLEGHSSQVAAVVFSPDGKLLASGSWNTTVKLWEASSGVCLLTLEGHSNWVTAVFFSPDGKLLASGSWDTTVKLWEASSGVCLQTLEGHSSQVTTVVFSPDGKLLASGSWDMTVKLWEVSSGVCLLTLEGHSSPVAAVVYAPDGKLLASGSWDNTVKLWEVSSGVCLQTLGGHSNHVTTVVFSPDGKLLASGSMDTTVKLWEVSSDMCLQALESHSNHVTTVVFSPDGKLLASGSWDTTVKLWEVSSGVCLQTLEGHSSPVTTVVFSPNGKLLASGSGDTTMKLWEASSGVCLLTLEGHSSQVTAVVFSPNGKLLASGSWDTTVKLWEVSSGVCLQTLEGHSNQVDTVVFSPDGKLLASGSWDTTVKLWEASSGVCLQTLEGHLDSVTAVVFSPDGKLLASGSRDMTVKLWEVSSVTCLHTLVIGMSPWRLWFDSFGSYIYADMGPMVIKLSLQDSMVRIIEPLKEGIVYSAWIMHGGNNVLWLPSEYRASCSSVYGDQVGFGTQSGRVWISNIDPDQFKREESAHN